MGNRKKKYLNDFITFDIETTTLFLNRSGELEKHALVYSGQFFDGRVYKQVRTIEDCVQQLKAYSREYADQDGQLIVFVHFLSYEFQFIKDFFDFDDVLAIQHRKIISATWRNLEFRCSYFLSNMGLSQFTKSENVELEFQKTKMDFKIRRYPWTPIAPSDAVYMRNDVVGLYKAIEHLIDRTTVNGTVGELPLTNTGYVRRDMRNAFNTNRKNRWKFLDRRMNLAEYNLTSDAFRGGNTHCNRFNSNKLITDVMSFDICSSYPFELLTKKYPTKWMPLRKYTWNEINFIMNRSEEYGLITKMSFRNMKIKPGIPVPYVSYSNLENAPKLKDCEMDNGRVLFAAQGTIAVTEVDLKIILDQYDFEPGSIRLSDTYYTVKEPLALEMKQVILNYFIQKSKLKDVDEYYYGKSKNRLNSCYGMFVMRPVRYEYIFDPVTHEIIEDTSKSDAQKLNEFYKSWSSFTSYQQGIYVTAYARASLQELIDKIDPDDFVYCDTDSVKCKYQQKYFDIVDKINKRKLAEAKRHHAYVEVNGKVYTMGIFEFEGIYPKFISFGAKKYLFKTPYRPKYQRKYKDKRRRSHSNRSLDGFGVTISGLPKEEGKMFLIEKLKKGEITSPFNIRKGFIFENVKSTMCFNDLEEPFTLHIQGHDVTIYSNIGSIDGNYTLGLAADYEALLLMLNGDIL